MSSIHLQIYKDRDSEKEHYHIKLIYKHKRFSLHFMTPEKLSKHEADYRVINIAADLDCDTDGIVVSN